MNDEEELLPAPEDRRVASDATDSAASSLHHFTPYGSDAIDVESVVSGCALIGMLFFACLLFAGVLEMGFGA